MSILSIAAVILLAFLIIVSFQFFLALSVRLLILAFFVVVALVAYSLMASCCNQEKAPEGLVGETATDARIDVAAGGVGCRRLTERKRAGYERLV